MHSVSGPSPYLSTEGTFIDSLSPSLVPLLAGLLRCLSACHAAPSPGIQFFFNTAVVAGLTHTCHLSGCSFLWKRVSRLSACKTCRWILSLDPSSKAKSSTCLQLGSGCAALARADTCTLIIRGIFVSGSHEQPPPPLHCTRRYFWAPIFYTWPCGVLKSPLFPFSF